MPKEYGPNEPKKEIITTQSPTNQNKGAVQVYYLPFTTQSSSNWLATAHNTILHQTHLQVELGQIFKTLKTSYEAKESRIQRISS